jgi:hypothetical protein
MSFITFLVAQLLTFLPTIVSNETLPEIGPKYKPRDCQILVFCVWNIQFSESKTPHDSNSTTIRAGQLVCPPWSGNLDYSAPNFNAKTLS